MAGKRSSSFCSAASLWIFCSLDGFLEFAHVRSMSMMEASAEGHNLCPRHGQVLTCAVLFSTINLCEMAINTEAIRNRKQSAPTGVEDAEEFVYIEGNLPIMRFAGGQRRPDTAGGRRLSEGCRVKLMETANQEIDPILRRRCSSRR